MKNYNIALSHLRKANKLLEHPDGEVLKKIILYEKYRSSKASKPTECWHNFCPEPPESLVERPEQKTKAETKTSGFPFVKIGPLQFENTNSERGWTVEARRNISVGEVILKEKPYVTVLTNPRTRNCYYCHKRCLGLQPCSECPYVGFCNEQCEENAKHVDSSNDTEPGRHAYECHGILPYLLIDQISSRQERDPSYTGCATTCHLAYRSIANTPQETLIDYITHSGRYKDYFRGHQAFETSTVVRKVLPPRRLMSTDYSSIAWLDPCTERRSRIELWQKTMAAVFLTYCLSISGYSMSWYGDDFYSAPDADVRPKIIPASWVAACILYHLQAFTINCQTNILLSSPTPKVTDAAVKQIATSVYPTYSLINHSCNPNAVLINTPQGGIFVFALHPIPKNSEVTVSYLHSCYSSPAIARRLELKYQYLFDCNCEACEGLWYEESLSKLVTLKCPKCENLFSFTEGVCTSCKSRRALKGYEKHVQKIHSLIKKCSNYLDSSPEDIVSATLSWGTIQNLCQPKGMAFTSIRTGYLNLMRQQCSNLVIEPFELK
ncbi:unnamed protein product [Rodentolepis nana]|uniref:SET domain-containing protein n=1 Tax=Rodentolepis nana TaxID=102285 RepID=A0A0R3TVM5_RODNA|nr:unnamed protein product [Rodentolepis nana]